MDEDESKKSPLATAIFRNEFLKPLPKIKRKLDRYDRILKARLKEALDKSADQV